jgi:hypothetical protein
MGNWRWATWLIVGWTVLMAVLMVVIYPEVPNTESYNPPPGDDTAAYQAGVAFGVALIYWVIGMIVLGPIWYFTRKRLLCPVCGNKVGANARMCGRCGYVPGMAFPQGAYPPQQPGWPQPQQPPQSPQSGWPPPPPPPTSGE